VRPSALTDPRGPLFPARVGHGLEPGSEEWVAWIEECDERTGYKVCGRSNRFDEPCMVRSPIQTSRLDGDPRYGRPACRNHGGHSLAGIASPAYRNGTASRYTLRGRLAGYHDRLDDMDYLSLHPELKITEELISAAVEVLDDPTPCPEQLDLPMLNPEVHGEEAAKAREAEHRQRAKEIAEWHKERAAATERYDALVELKAKLARTEIARVKAAQDTLSGGAVRLFSQTLLEINRRRLLAFGARHGVPAEEVLDELANLQEEIVNAVLNSKGTGVS